MLASCQVVDVTDVSLTGIGSTRQTFRLANRKAAHAQIRRKRRLRLLKGLTVIALAMPAFGQYAGPAILSRGEAPSAMSDAQISFRPYLELTGIYDTGLAGVAVVNAAGDLANDAAYGIEATIGLSGVHAWKHTKLGLDYRGSFREYNQKRYYDGTDQTLLFSVSHQFTRHVALLLRETAGMFSQDFGLLGLPQTAGYDPSGATVPTTDFYDNRTIYLSTQADLMIQKTARLSFDFGGDGYLVRRRSSALYGMTGAAARADVQYRLTRRTTIGGLYSYTHYDFIGILGGSDIHTAAVTYATALSRWWEISGNAGFARVENRFEQLVPVPPAIEALLGYAYVPAVTYGVSYVPNVNVRLSRTFPKGVAYITGERMVNPGNGLFLTSTMTEVMAGYNYTGLRRWSFGANGGYQASQSLGNLVGRYNTGTAGFTVSRQITRGFHALASFTARKYGSPDFARYNRPVYDVRIGFGFTPGDVPLRVW